MLGHKLRDGVDGRARLRRRRPADRGVRRRAQPGVDQPDRQRRRRDGRRGHAAGRDPAPTATTSSSRSPTPAPGMPPRSRRARSRRSSRPRTSARAPASASTSPGASSSSATAARSRSTPGRARRCSGSASPSDRTSGTGNQSPDGGLVVLIVSVRGTRFAGMVRSKSHPILSRRALNRATLARQQLLERSSMQVSRTLVEHLVGLQAQTPHSWYVGLWTRLVGFHAMDVSDLLDQRRVVRIALMRSTIHLVTARDCLALRPIFQPVLERSMSGNFGKNLVGLNRPRAGGSRPPACWRSGRVLSASSVRHWRSSGRTAIRRRSLRRCGPGSRWCRCRHADCGGAVGSPRIPPLNRGSAAVWQETSSRPIWYCATLARSGQRVSRTSRPGPVSPDLLRWWIGSGRVSSPSPTSRDASCSTFPERHDPTPILRPAALPLRLRQPVAFARRPQSCRYRRLRPPGLSHGWPNAARHPC